MSLTPAIDIDHLRRFTLGDRELEAELFELFLGQVPTSLTQMQQSKTVESWAFAAHSIKGAARAVGAMKIAQLASEAEDLEFENSAARDAIIVDLTQALADVHAFVRDTVESPDHAGSA